MPPKSKAQLERQCKAWNDKHPIGKWVRVSLDNGVKRITRTRSAAYVLSGHSAVIFAEGISGCYSLDRVEAIDTVKGVAS
jgi:hypothetical protein